MTAVEPQVASAGLRRGVSLRFLPSMSMRQLLALLVLATALPLLALTFVMYQQLVAREHAATRASLMTSARTLVALTENEIETHMAVAAALATSPDLASGDIEAFRRQAKQAVEILPGAWLSLSDPNGHFVMTTLLDPGAPLPPRGNLDVMQRAWSSGKPQLSDLVMGPISKRHNAFIEYPVFKAGVPLYSIVMGLNPDRFLALIHGKFPEGGAVGILDRNRKFIARLPDHDARVGTLASEDWRAAIDREPEGLLDVRTLEGQLSLTAYVPTAQGWTAGISYPLSLLDTPVRRVLWTMGLLSAVLIGGSMFLGIALARQLGAIMSSLAGAASKVGAGETVTAEPLAVREAAAISQALSTSSLQLASRERALRESEARFRGTFENAAVGVAHVGLDGKWRSVNQRLCDILGYSAGDLVNHGFQDITHKEDATVERENLRKLLSGETALFAMDKRFLRSNGDVGWVALTMSLQRDLAGTAQYFIAIVEDISLRKEAQAHQRFLLQELAHRSKNQLAVIQAMAGQTARNSASLADFAASFTQRIQGLAVATEVLVAQNWSGAPVSDLVRRQLETFEPEPERLICDGPPLSFGTEAAQSIGLALHELATNCVKYGAWSAPRGIVTVRWTLEQNVPDSPRLRLEWRESGGPAVAEPERKGFGQMVIRHMVAQKLGGTVDTTFAPEGLRWTLWLPHTHYKGEDSEIGPGVQHVAKRVKTAF